MGKCFKTCFIVKSKQLTPGNTRAIGICLFRALLFLPHTSSLNSIRFTLCMAERALAAGVSLFSKQMTGRTIYIGG